MKAYPETDLDGLTNAWCSTVVGFSGLINIVKTGRE
jgi:hypothetical protein